MQRETEIEGVGQFVDFDPHNETDFPSEPDVYVFYDVSDRSVYVGRADTFEIESRIIT